MFTILVAEDDSDMRELFCTVLTDSGYRCIPAEDGQAALDAMEKEYVDLIVMDIMMPHVDGYTLTKTLREAKCDLPILMVTAKDQFEDLQRGFRAGSDDYMVKPINVRELVLRVEALLRRARISAEKKIVVGDTILDYDALTVTIHGKETILPLVCHRKPKSKKDRILNDTILFLWLHLCKFCKLFRIADPLGRIT